MTDIFGLIMQSKHIETTINAPLKNLLERGGKRWRPMLFAKICKAMGGNYENWKEMQDFIELIHNGSLIIDDVEDNSELRRGKPALHKIYGTDTAVNLGCTLYFIPLKMLFEKKYEPFLTQIFKAYVEEVINAHYGQAMDIAWHKGQGNPTEQDYLEMCSLKTGALSRLSARLACILSNAEPADSSKAENLAEKLGIAVQIKDDILNLTATSGKNQFIPEYIGSDITEGKKSIIVIHALKHLTRPEELLGLLGTTDKEQIKKAVQIIKQSGSIDYAEKLADKIIREAWEESKSCFKDKNAAEELEAFIEQLADRKY